MGNKFFCPFKKGDMQVFPVLLFESQFLSFRIFIEATSFAIKLFHQRKILSIFNGRMSNTRNGIPYDYDCSIPAFPKTYE